MEDSRHPKHPEDDHAGQKEKGQDRQQIDNSVEGDQEPQPGTEFTFIRIQIICCPDPQNVFHTEDQNGDNFYYVKCGKQRGKLIKGL